MGGSVDSILTKGNSLTEEEARDPMGAIYNVQIVISNTQDEIKSKKEHLEKLEKRLEFLRGIVRIRLGTT